MLFSTTSSAQTYKCKLLRQSLARVATMGWFTVVREGRGTHLAFAPHYLRCCPTHPSIPFRFRSLQHFVVPASYLAPLLEAIPVAVLEGGSSGCVRKSGSLAGVGEAVLGDDGGERSRSLVGATADARSLATTAGSSALLLFLGCAAGGGGDLARSRGGVCSPLSFNCGGFGGGEEGDEAEAAALWISRCTTSSATLGEGGDGGGGGADDSVATFFSTGSYRCSLRRRRQRKEETRIHFGTTSLLACIRQSIRRHDHDT